LGVGLVGVAWKGLCDRSVTLDADDLKELLLFVWQTTFPAFLDAVLFLKTTSTFGCRRLRLVLVEIFEDRDQTA
tara:strand:+ start:51961 stop:52182 length:222 start_codon:yes stop_codon:yes gene_type:complete